MNEAGECELAIADTTRKVDGKYPILGKIMVPMCVLSGMAESCADKLPEAVADGNWQPPDVNAGIDNLLGVIGPIDEANERFRRNRLGGGTP